jgi:hypothetical protein
MSQTAFSVLESILLLIMGFFLGVLANLVTPTFQNWWAALSFSRLKKRIETLRAEAEEMKSKEPISIAESDILKTVERIERYVILILALLMASALEGALLVHRFVPPRPFSWSRFSIVNGIALIVLIYVARLIFSEGASSFFRSEDSTWSLIADLKELEAKLEKWRTKR